MAITRKAVEDDHLTTLMITHNMASALSTGTRTIMMDEGNILLDLSGEEREHTSVDDLLKLYAGSKHRAFDNDRMMLQ